MLKNIESPISKRFIEVLDFFISKGVIASYYKLSKDLRLRGASKFNDIKTNRSTPDATFIHEIGVLYPCVDMNKSYILFGEGSIIANETVHGSNVKVPGNGSGKRNMIIVPAKAYGGFLQGYADPEFLESLKKIEFPKIQGECYQFEVEGFSMIPQYPPQSDVIATAVENINWLRKDKDYVFQTIDGILLKRFSKIEDNNCYVYSINKEYKDIKLPLKNIKRVYLVEKRILDN